MSDEQKPDIVRGKPFTPGVSGNPGGRPKDAGRITALARSYAVEAIETLVQIMRGKNDKLRLLAAMALLDRGLGRPLPSAIPADDPSPPVPHDVLTDASAFGSLRGKVLDAFNANPERAFSKNEMAEEIGPAPAGAVGAICVQLAVDKFIRRVAPGKFQAQTEGEPL